VNSAPPRFLTRPADTVSSTGAEAVELAALAGLHLDPWQQLILDGALGERPDGSWAAFEVGVVVPRQNGKGALLEARELAGLFLLGERLIVHSAHLFDTSLEAFRRLLELIESTPELDQRVQRVSRSHGEEGIELRGGQRIRFRTRTRGGGRGLSADLVVLDEAMILPTAVHGALLPTLSARPNPQVWYTGSAVDQAIHDDGVVLARVRERGIAGDPRLFYAEWSLDRANPADVTLADAADPAAWHAANPALDVRISREHVTAEQRALDGRAFAVERLNVGDWPATDDTVEHVIDPDLWNQLADDTSTIHGRPVFAFDVSPDRSRTAIAAAGRRDDGLLHVEVIAHGPGTGWIVDELTRLKQRYRPTRVVCDAAGPAGALVARLANAGVTADALSAREHADACGTIVDSVNDRALRHTGTDELYAAIRGAATRPLGESWAWARRSSTVDISPLVAATLALGTAAAARSKGLVAAWA